MTAVDIQVFANSEVESFSWNREEDFIAKMKKVCRNNIIVGKIGVDLRRDEMSLLHEAYEENHTRKWPVTRVSVVDAASCLDREECKHALRVCLNA